MKPAQVINMMTVDVEDYFQVSAFDRVVRRSAWDSMPSRVVRNTDRLLEIFAEHGVVATFFVLGWVAEKFPELVVRIARAGHEVASHGTLHRLVYHQTRDGFREDVRKAKRVLESVCGASVKGYRAPSYSITARSLWAIDVLIEEGYVYDASIFPIRHDRYGIPDFERRPHVLKSKAGGIVEFPGSTVRFGGMNWPIAGGGYFRILPYEWTQAGIAHLNRHEGPAIFYLHPWEIDPDQPRLKAGRLGRFRHYRNLAKTEGRLRQLLKDFRFGPMRDALSELVANPQGVSADGLARSFAAPSHQVL